MKEAFTHAFQSDLSWHGQRDTQGEGGQPTPAFEIHHAKEEIQSNGVLSVAVKWDGNQTIYVLSRIGLPEK